MADGKITRGPITIDSARHRVLVGGKPVVLTAVEFKFLSMLMQRPGRVQARDRLLNEVWGYESAIDTRTVDTHVRRLREKLGKAASVIETVRGFGYRLARITESSMGWFAFALALAALALRLVAGLARLDRALP